MQKSTFVGLTVLYASALLIGCASTTDPNSVGTGRYLQFFSRDGRVIVEMDTHMSGMMNCPNQAYHSIQSNPTMASLTKCSNQSFAGVLPFSFLAHRRLNESDGYRPSSPYLTRTSTSQLCTTIRQDTSKMEKTFIVEDNCHDSSPTTVLPSRGTSGGAGQSPAASSPAVAESLRQLDRLKRDGLISEEEYNSRRKSILDRL